MIYIYKAYIQTAKRYILLYTNFIYHYILLIGNSSNNFKIYEQFNQFTYNNYILKIYKYTNQDIGLFNSFICKFIYKIMLKITSDDDTNNS